MTQPITGIKHCIFTCYQFSIRRMRNGLPSGSRALLPFTQTSKYLHSTIAAVIRKICATLRAAASSLQGVRKCRPSYWQPWTDEAPRDAQHSCTKMLVVGYTTMRFLDLGVFLLSRKNRAASRTHVSQPFPKHEVIRHIR